MEDRIQHNDDHIDYFDDVTYCEVCGRDDGEERMLLCDGCDHGYHLECLTPQLNEIPIGVWYCSVCIQVSSDDDREDDDYDVTFELPEAEINVNNIISTRSRRNTTLRQIARTRFSERIRRRINNTRLQRGASIVVSETDDDEYDLNDENNENDEISLKDELLDLLEDNPVETTKFKKVFKKKVIRRRKRKYKTKKRKTTKTFKSSTNKKTGKRRKRKRSIRKKKYAIKRKRIKPTETQKRILKSYKSTLKSERLEEKNRVNSGIPVIKPFSPGLSSEINEYDDSSIFEKYLK